MEYRNLKDHLIICGWKHDMKEVLDDILNITVDLSSERIVLVSNVDSERIEDLKEADALRALMFLRGDYFSEKA